MSSPRPPEARAGSGPLAEIDVAILAGGLGTRLRGVLGETPKVLAPVGDKAFLDHLFAWLKGFGARRIVLCLGHRAEKVLDHLIDHLPDGLEVVTVVEPEPLGTAGGLRYARDKLLSDPVLVMNGDTFVDADLGAFVTAYRKSGSAASILATAVPSMARYGRLELDAGGMIRRFAEKDPSDTGPGLINAGLYLFSAGWLDQLAASSAASLERDMLTAAPPGTYHAVPTGETAFIDIGTPESLASAGAVLAQALGRLHPTRDVA
jgi:NDP-sugar pyrophosphorylase family protein